MPAALWADEGLTASNLVVLGEEVGILTGWCPRIYRGHSMYVMRQVVKTVCCLVSGQEKQGPDVLGAGASSQGHWEWARAL